MTLHDVDQGTEAWHELRLGKFTASDAKTIATGAVGLDTLVFQKVAERLTGKSAIAPYTNADMERGKELEEMARNSYEIETGIVVKRVGFAEHNEFIGCSPDGIIDTEGMQEIKCPNDANYARYRFEGKINAEHYWQMQMQMWIMNRKWCDYVVFNPNFNDKPVIITRVPINDEDIKKLVLGLTKGVDKMQEILAKI